MLPVNLKKFLAMYNGTNYISALKEILKGKNANKDLSFKKAIGSLGYLIQQGNDIKDWTSEKTKYTLRWHLEKKQPLPFYMSKADKKSDIGKQYVVSLGYKNSKSEKTREWMPWLKLVFPAHIGEYQLLTAKAFVQGCTIGIVTGETRWTIDVPGKDEPSKCDILDITGMAVENNNGEFLFINKKAVWRVIQTLPLPNPQGMGMHYLHQVSDHAEANVCIMPDGRVVAERDIKINQRLCWYTKQSMETMLKTSVFAEHGSKPNKRIRLEKNK